MTKKSISLLTINGGEPCMILPRISVEICKDNGAQVLVFDGLIGHTCKDGGITRRDTGLKIRLLQTGNLDPSVLSIMAIELEGDNDWQNHIEFSSRQTERGQAWESFVPFVIDDEELCTKPHSNSIKLMVFEKGGFFSEHTVSITSQVGNFYAVHQVNRERFQCFRDEKGAFDPKSKSWGKQPKRTQISEVIAKTFELDTTVPIWTGPLRQQAPDNTGLAGNQARVIWWTCRRNEGAAVLPSGEQVKIYAKHLDGMKGFRFLEPGTVVEFSEVRNAGDGSSFRHKIIGVRELKPELV